MIDIKKIRETPDVVRAGLAARGADPAAVDTILGIDAKRREAVGAVEALKAERNAVSKKIGAMRKAGEDTSGIQAETRKLGEKIAELDAQAAKLDEEQRSILLSLPNLPAPGVVPGGKEANEVVSVWGEKPSFDFEPKDHVELCTKLGLIDYDRGVRLGGNGFWLYRGMGARIEWALLNYFIQEHVKDGFEFILPPHLLTYECGLTAGQFPKFEEDVFRLKEVGFQFLLPTAETALVNLHRGEIVEEKDLPQKMFAYTPCYRREAGSYRKEERGMIRGHQFDKVEMFAYTKPEESEAMLQLLIRKACKLVEGLGLHYRLSKLAAGDCSASMATTYDVELWIPSMGVYKECSSVSNAMDYQARRGNMRFRRAADKKIEFMHTLNGSGLATSRLLPAIVEQFQRADGSVAIPEVLRPFLGGVSEIRPA
ncbi:MAG: serine--tRNA ligase [Kiritimatiellae bacterium]|nr:serine--tRNA ligase [Kiritimatiellia bacterium]